MSGRAPAPPRTYEHDQRPRAALPRVAAPVVSVGSTPTATYADELADVTEVRAGVFVFFDLVMAGIDVCGTGDIALSVLATVIGHQEDKGWVLIDAGTRRCGGISSPSRPSG